MKKDIADEFQRYKNYLDRYFPMTSLAKSVSEEEVANVFDNCMTLSKIAHHLSDCQQISYLMSLIEYNLNNLLYFLPMNEIVSCNVSVRNCTEAILKLVFTLEDKTVDHNSTGYRTMKDERSRLSVYQDAHKDEIDNLFSIYASRSNSVHLKKELGEELRKVLESKLTRDLEKSELVKLNQDIRNCKQILLEIILFYRIDLSTPQKLNLSRFVSRAWKEKISEI